MQMLCVSYGKDVRPSVRLSVCHTLLPYQSYDHEIFTVSSVKDFAIRILKAFLEISKGTSRSRAINNTEVGKICEVC